jgi:hypothetical protein
LDEEKSQNTTGLAQQNGFGEAFLLHGLLRLVKRRNEVVYLPEKSVINMI